MPSQPSSSTTPASSEEVGRGGEMGGGWSRRRTEGTREEACDTVGMFRERGGEDIQRAKWRGRSACKVVRAFVRRAKWRGCPRTLPDQRVACVAVLSHLPFRASSTAVWCVPSLMCTPPTDLQTHRHLSLAMRAQILVIFAHPPVRNHPSTSPWSPTH